MSTKRTNISLKDTLYIKGLKRQKEKDFSNFSDYVEDLIRRDVHENAVAADDSVKEDPVPYKPTKRLA